MEQPQPEQRDPRHPGDRRGGDAARLPHRPPAEGRGLRGMSFLEVSELAKRYGATSVFQGVSFAIEKGEFVCIVGHSGCGKTTILNVLAGLEETTTGSVRIDGEPVTRPGLDRGVVFQGHALMPWMSALDNVVFAVRSRHKDF